MIRKLSEVLILFNGPINRPEKSSNTPLLLKRREIELELHDVGPINIGIRRAF